MVFWLPAGSNLPFPMLIKQVRATAQPVVTMLLLWLPTYFVFAYVSIAEKSLSQKVTKWLYFAYSGRIPHCTDGNQNSHNR